MDDQLSDLETRVDIEAGDAVVDEDDADFTPVTRVDRTRCIQHGHLVLQCEAAAWANTLTTTYGTGSGSTETIPDE